MNKVGIIYKVISPSRKVYIGQTIYKLEHRKKRHISNANNKQHKLYNTKFYRAIRKYNKTLEWNIIHTHILRIKLNELERKEIFQHNSFNFGYNSDLGGGVKSPEDLRKQCAKKENHPFAKVNQKIVDKMRIIYSDSESTYKDISKIFNNIISPNSVGKIIRNVQWRDDSYSIKINKYSGVGERNSHAKLNKRDVRKIRQKYSSGKYTHRQLAVEYAVKEPAIYKIINLLTWKNI